MGNQSELATIVQIDTYKRYREVSLVLGWSDAYSLLRWQTRVEWKLLGAILQSLRIHYFNCQHVTSQPLRNVVHVWRRKIFGWLLKAARRLFQATKEIFLCKVHVPSTNISWLVEQSLFKNRKPHSGKWKGRQEKMFASWRGCLSAAWGSRSRIWGFLASIVGEWSQLHDKWKGWSLAVSQESRGKSKGNLWSINYKLK